MDILFKEKIDKLKKLGRLICLIDVSGKKNYYICSEISLNINDCRIINAIDVSELMIGDKDITTIMITELIKNKFILSFETLKFINFSTIIYE